MSVTSYTINKNINKPIEFKGLKAQYITWLGAGLLLLLILFVILYFCGMNSFVCLGIIVVLGCILFTYVFRISHRYGEHGMMKKLARRKVPSLVRQTSIQVFF